MPFRIRPEVIKLSSYGQGVVSRFCRSKGNKWASTSVCLIHLTAWLFIVAACAEGRGCVPLYLRVTL